MVKKKKDKKFGFFGDFSLWFVDRPRFTAALLIGAIGFGLLSYTGLIKREGFPPVNLPIAIVQGVYVVNNPAVVDDQVAQPLQESISQIDAVEKVSTTTTGFGASVVASLSDGSSTEAIQDELESAINSTELPEDAQVQIIEFNAAKYLGQYDMILSVYAENGATAAELEKKATEIAPLFSELEEVSVSQVESLFETGFNPFTQQEETRQVAFNQVGRSEVQGEDMEFFSTAVIGITGLGEDDLDIFELSEAVNSKLDELNEQSSDDTVITVSADFTTFVSGQISSLQNNVVTGIIAILLVSTIIIGWRVSAIMAIFVLSVLAVTIGILYLIGLSLNVITLFALVLALGLFVDDATIISEAIDARKRKYKGYREVIGRAVSSVGSASFAGTVTTILVFFPLLFISGILGEFIVAMPMTVITALMTSLVLSLTLIPWLSQYTILTKKSVANTKANSPWKLPAKGVKWTGSFLANGIRSLRSKKHRWFGVGTGVTMFLVSIVFMVGAVYFAGQLGFNIFPSSKDTDEILLNIQYGDGTTITQAEEIAFATNEVVEQSIGAEMVELDYGGEGLANTTSADARIQLVNFRERDITAPQLIERLEADLATSGVDGVIYNVTQQDPGGPQSPIPYSMQVYSEDVSVAMKASADIEQFISGLTLTLNNGDEAHVIITDKSDASKIFRTDGRQYVSVYAGYDSDQVSELLQLTRDEVKEYYTTEKLIELGLTGNQETDLGFDFGLESDNEESFQSLGQIGIFSLLAMFILLAIQFRSILKPILIFLAIPFSLFGVTFGLYITGNVLSFFAMIGFIGLIGIAVNNTILLVDAASRYKREGKGRVESIALGLEERFRPLVTTTTTTVVALLPLAIFDPFWEPLAVTVIFGLISSTILVILSFPAYYIAFDTVSDWFARKFAKGSK